MYVRTSRPISADRYTAPQALSSRLKLFAGSTYVQTSRSVMADSNTTPRAVTQTFHSANPYELILALLLFLISVPSSSSSCLNELLVFCIFCPVFSPRRKSFLGLGLTLTLAYFVAGSPSSRLPGSSTQKDRSPSGATFEVGSFARGSQSSRCSGSKSYEEFPFEIWYCDNSIDDSSTGSLSWMDFEVVKVSSVLTSSSSLLSMVEAICQRGPWSVKVSPCLRGELVGRQSTGLEGPFFYFYETLPLKLGVRLPFTHFER
ncbi:hypothetical protein CR513_56333, partial [Mucuna pruriens]